jgi:hypothetical protein
MCERSRSYLRAIWCLLAFLAGCEDEARVTSKPQIKTRKILGETTQDVRPAAPELKAGGAQEASGKVIAKDPITLPGNVYVVAVDRIAAGNVKHALDLYQASTGAYPKDYKEFMDEIIKPDQPDGIRLPRLPYYQEYGYDEKEHKLIILEYPDRKAQFQEQQDKQFGRR